MKQYRKQHLYCYYATISSDIFYLKINDLIYSVKPEDIPPLIIRVLSNIFVKFIYK